MAVRIIIFATVNLCAKGTVIMSICVYRWSGQKIVLQLSQRLRKRDFIILYPVKNERQSSLASICCIWKFRRRKRINLIRAINELGFIHWTHIAWMGCSVENCVRNEELIEGYSKGQSQDYSSGHWILSLFASSNFSKNNLFKMLCLRDKLRFSYSQTVSMATSLCTLNAQYSRIAMNSHN